MAAKDLIVSHGLASCFRLKVEHCFQRTEQSEASGSDDSELRETT